jgi:hypothetical protein
LQKLIKLLGRFDGDARSVGEGAFRLMGLTLGNAPASLAVAEQIFNSPKKNTYFSQQALTAVLHFYTFRP